MVANAKAGNFKRSQHGLGILVKKALLYYREERETTCIFTQATLYSRNSPIHHSTVHAITRFLAGSFVVNSPWDEVQEKREDPGNER